MYEYEHMLRYRLILTLFNDTVSTAELI